LKNNFNPEKSGINIDYDWDSESITWCFQRMAKDNGLTFTMQTLVINAHNGSIIRMQEGGGIR